MQYGCNATETSVGLPHGVDCDASKFLHNTKMPCGEAIKFTNETSPADCCAACQATSGCTNWVYDYDAPTSASVHTFFTVDVDASGQPVADDGNCHLKSLPKPCPEHEAGAVSGGAAAPPAPAPGPSPHGPATCTNEYSTDLWGQMALQAVAEHDLAGGPLYVER